MKKLQKQILSFIVFGIILVLGVSVVSEPSFASNQKDWEKMEVHFLDVGQGDATLITCGNHAMLIDAADDTKGTAIQNYLQKQNIQKLDYLILTHPDSDHIGGAPVIITKFEIDKVFVSNYEKDNRTYEKLIQALDYKRLKAFTPKTGSEYSLGTATITILGPNKEYDNPNDSSIAIMVQNGDNKFLFTSDATETAETDIMKNNPDISAQVYHAGHHGSKNSTSEEFFKAVNPAYAVISCGEGNSYGHPHAQTLNTFRINGVKVYRTDEAGTIVAIADGKNITFQVPASETWKSGEPVGSSLGNVQNSSQVLSKETSASVEITYVLNKNTHKFHKITCSSVKDIKDKNREDTTKSRNEIVEMGYEPCKRCNP